jgi:hypothetical protein
MIEFESVETFLRRHCCEDQLPGEFAEELGARFLRYMGGGDAACLAGESGGAIFLSFTRIAAPAAAVPPGPPASASGPA